MTDPRTEGAEPGPPSRRRFLSGGLAVATACGAGCLARNPPVAEPSEGFAELRLRVVNDAESPVDAFVTITTDAGDGTGNGDDDETGNGDDDVEDVDGLVEEISIVGLPPGEATETRSVAYPRRRYAVHVPAGERPTYPWDADVCATFGLELRFVDGDVKSATSCEREW